MLRMFWHLIVIACLTVLTQLGGVAWLFSLFFRRQLFIFALAYLAMTSAATLAAPYFGRVAINCWETGPLEVQSWLYCALNRNYVTPEMKTVLLDVAQEVDQEFPATKTLVLDANFPFMNGFPLLPHLSHDDGEKVDIAFFYRDDIGYVPGETKSPIGYFAFEEGPTDCPSTWPTLRWNLKTLQSMWRNLELEPNRTKYALTALSNHPQTGRIFLEPHLKERLSISSRKVRFQGCKAARHDDHIHVQL